MFPANEEAEKRNNYSVTENKCIYVENKLFITEHEFNFFCIKNNNNVNNNEKVNSFFKFVY